MEFWNCVRYLAVISVAAFFVGRLIPKTWLCPTRFPYRSFKFERDGKIYDKLHIRRWQNKVPDMSKILPRLIPPKNLCGAYKERLPLMIQETCVAELIHGLHCFAGLYCLHLWPGTGGAVLALLFALCNLPFILIQRYNRPRLLRLSRRLGHEPARAMAVGALE